MRDETEKDNMDDMIQENELERLCAEDVAEELRRKRIDSGRERSLGYRMMMAKMDDETQEDWDREEGAAYDRSR